ncbi:MAG: proline--tRNA ligase, partial [Chloroflexi bacterium]|nr:proline--tRNA ligase [Chloroflexota bacterium]
FPTPIAPFQVHLIALNADDAEVSKQAEALYAELEAAGHEVFFDDRLESAGVKFNDADLLGFPVRVVVSPRNLKSGVVEIKRRRDADARQAAPDAVGRTVAELLAKDDL